MRSVEDALGEAYTEPAQDARVHRLGEAGCAAGLTPSTIRWAHPTWSLLGSGVPNANDSDGPRRLGAPPF